MFVKALQKTCNNIYYLERCRDSKQLILNKCWQPNDIFGVKNNYSTGNRFIFLHAGREAGFVNGGMLLYKAGTKSEDYQMNTLILKSGKKKIVYIPVIINTLYCGTHAFD